MMNTQELIEWKKAMEAMPKVWVTVYHEIGEEECFGSIYESREAAELEQKWHANHGNRRVKCYVREDRISSLPVARMRWA